MPREVRTKLRQLRLNRAAHLGREVTLQEVHKATGIAVSTLSDLEQGRVKGIKFDTIVRLADFYAVDNIGDMLSLEELRHALRVALAGHLTARRAGGEVAGMVAAVPALHPRLYGTRRVLATMPALPVFSFVRTAL
jgi:DNA-binding Xre family transcriptional regulator